MSYNTTHIIQCKFTAWSSCTVRQYLITELEDSLFESDGIAGADPGNQPSHEAPGGLWIK